MSLAQKAARGALWTVTSSTGGRAVGVLGALVLTRFLDPHTIGEVAVAVVLVMSANWITLWGFGQYAVVKGRGVDALEVTFHATVFSLVLGALSLGAIAVAGGTLVVRLGAPGAAGYVPWLALAFFIQRVRVVPERVLTRQMNFRPSGLALMVGEMAYAATAVGLAARGMGGFAIVIGNLVQSAVALAIIVRAAGVASWLTPVPLRRERIREMLRFGVPLGLQGIASQAARFWDRPMISYHLGAGAAGAYNMAYNLADIPAIQVGEQFALVLTPSMAELPRDRRAAALERSSRLMALIIFPLAIGLGLVASPLISLVLPHNEWQAVAPLLTVLACLSLFRPITWLLSSYFEAESKTNRLMFLELGKLGLLLGGIAILHPHGVRAAASAVGLAFGAAAAVGLLIVMREGPSPARLLAGFLRPLAACAAMALAVGAAHELLSLVGIEQAAIHLAAMIVAGAIAYVGAAFVVAREASLDLIRLFKRALE